MYSPHAVYRPSAYHRSPPSRHQQHIRTTSPQHVGSLMSYGRRPALSPHGVSDWTKQKYQAVKAKFSKKKPTPQPQITPQPESPPSMSQESPPPMISPTTTDAHGPRRYGYPQHLHQQRRPSPTYGGRYHHMSMMGPRYQYSPRPYHLRSPSSSPRHMTSMHTASRHQQHQFPLMRRNAAVSYSPPPSAYGGLHRRPRHQDHRYPPQQRFYD